ncbi:cupin domain-containing protein [Sciscionella marina]|uniref:cupin domain-containing protein n=1 Tax=Sciscionella marina TaxID=508770 RepID=UPI00036CFFBD|nr:cupin domain-containing protein [Sciscionella marina]
MHEPITGNNSAADRAVHCYPREAETRTNPGGDNLTTIIYAPAVTTQRLSTARLQIPGGVATTPQHHRESETALVVLSGHVIVLSGQKLRTLRPVPGDMVYIPATIPYTIANLSHHAPVLLLAFRTDPAFTADVTRNPELEPAASARIEGLRTQHHQDLMTRRAARGRRGP